MVCQRSMQHCITWMYIPCTRVPFIPYASSIYLLLSSSSNFETRNYPWDYCYEIVRALSLSFSLARVLKSGSFERSLRDILRGNLNFNIVPLKRRVFEGCTIVILYAFRIYIYIKASFEYAKVSSKDTKSSISVLFSRTDRRKELIFKGYWKSMWNRGETPCSWNFRGAGHFYVSFFSKKKREEGRRGRRDTKLKVGLSLGYPPGRQTKVESRE